jgi:serine/threonine-protein kinase
MNHDLQSAIGKSLGDAYHVERELGGGGMSRVFLATDHALGRQVVVKVLPPELAAGVSVDRFRREIALAASMQHPHIVPLLAASSDPALLWFTMPFVQGSSLRDRLAQSGELPIAEAIRLLREVADALSYAHKSGIVHRDIKPENVLLSGGHAMVTDFGVAKAIAASASDVSVTGTGLALGTPLYMAPEQASADPTTDHRADIYAFGILAFEVLAGQPPFSGTNAAQLIRAHLTENAPSVRTRREHVPEGVDDLIARCLSKRPADRPQSADELVTALDAAIIGATSSRTSAAAAQRPERRIGVMVGALAVVLAVAVGGYALFSRPTAATSRPRVVVQPFVNATGDASLNEMGTMVATWAQDAFTRSEVLDVADFRSALAGSADKGSGNDAISMAERAGASRVLTGSIYRVGDSLEFRANIVDGAQATVVTVIPPVRALASDPMRGIELLAERAAGAFASGEGSVKQALSGAPHLPTLEAYREFVTGVQHYSNTEMESAVTAFRRTIAADSAFLTAHVWLARALGNLRANSSLSVSRRVVDSIYASLDARRRELSPLDQAVVEASIHGRAGARDKELPALRRAAALWPDRWATNLVQTLQYAGRPHEALDVAKTIDPTVGFVRGWSTHYPNVVYAYELVGDYERAVAYAREGIARFPDDVTTLCPLITSLTLKRAYADVDSLLRGPLSTVRESPVQNRIACHSLVAARAASTWPEDSARAFMQRYRETVREANRRGVVVAAQGVISERDVSVWLGEYTTVLEALDSIAASGPTPPGAPGNLQWRRAWVLAKLGRRTEAEQLMQQLTTDPSFERLALQLEFLARLHLALGNRAEAARLVRESVERGRITYHAYFSPFFRELRGMPEFESMVSR